MTPNEILTIVANYDEPLDPCICVWLPRPGRREKLCGDSRAEIGEDEVCHLVEGHPGCHYDVKQEVSWAPNWRALRGILPNSTL